jgi:polysaccharide biosynthesis transport protein
MPTQSTPAGLLRRHALLIITITLLTTAGAVGVSLTRPAPYVSVSRVVVDAERVKGGGTPLAPDMGTEREIALSGEVARTAGDDLGLAPDAASANLQVDVPVETNVLEFSYSADTGEQAFFGAQVFTQAYVDYRNGSRSSVAQIITPPSVPSEPTRPNLYLVLALSLLVGLGLGVAIAYAWDRLSRRLRDITDVESYTGLPVLAAIPTLRAAPNERFVVASQQFASGAEAYGLLTARLLALLEQHDVGSVVITSPSDGAGKTTVTLNLAASLAAAGKDTVVLSADSRDTTMHIRSGVTRRPGLQELLHDDATLADALHDTEIEGLRILPSGGSTQVRRAGLNIRRLTAVLDELSRATEVVLIEAPSVLDAADTAILAEQADLTLLVVDIRRGRRADAAAAVHTLSHIGSRLSGCVVNDPGRKPHTPLLPQPGVAFRHAVFSRRDRSKFRGLINEGHQNVRTTTSPSIHANGSEAAARLRAGAGPAGADAANGTSGDTDRRVADLQ